MTQRIVLTGANGFVGQAVSRLLLARGDAVTGIVRRPGTVVDGVQAWLLDSDDFGEIETRWPDALRCDTVIHLAARVHVMRDRAIDPLAAYRETNVAGTLRVARAARRAGARRFVFVSSIKAVGESSAGREPISELVPPAPIDPYGISKLEAERALTEFGSRSGLEVTIVRPPLVYGPGVRANFLQLMNAIAKGVPLPLGAVQARRSMVYVDNLADALVHCATDRRAAGTLFHVTDGHDLSVVELARMLGWQLHVPARFISIPPQLLRLAGRVTGRSAQIARLLDELRVDSSHITEVLGWRAPYTVEQGLLETAAWYRATH
ncbi:NAD-dependent epimerase/dehydratase family protein [Paraburkholderia acidiphila]|uniref:NAD-dependent epimerase/dehydratase family protein n=1 Tax=Paraburkholderia acidiphila TaxID=2571747 RepID=A0A7Z2G2H1_9BURK|nr:NAD-dependent epimerase/dehydratase family protein [Paraburkholderia acidiphila]QGZ54018.1 NAD-dependent epimerase/dehydratase family protein [Paraburkholderia acidiphila]